MKRFFSSLNIVYGLHVAFFALVVTGIIPREFVRYETLVLLVYLSLATVEDGAMFFVRAIPLFLAIPLTATFDNFNQWRLFALVLFIRWLFERETWHYIIVGLIVLVKRPRAFIREHSWLITGIVLLVLAGLSLWHAPDSIVGIKRIIYFLNAALIGLVIAYPPHSERFRERLVRNMIPPVIVVVLVGLIQVISTYYIDIYQFMRIWGEGIQLNQFGEQWSYIATHVGNTWFAYFGEQLSLRSFSLFPDSHSFPIFLLLGLPAFFAWSITKPLARAEKYRAMITTRGKLTVLWIPAIFLMMILSGTRGIWAGAVAMVLWIIIVRVFMRWQKVNQLHKNIFRYIGSYLVIFFLLFLVAYPIFSSPQFLLSKGNALLLERRLRSILDFGETSNSQRLDIWKKSLVSIARNPVLGVGIGNFPVILDQKIQLSKAGSSAHNIYLHVAAEMGLAAGILFIWWCWSIIKHLYRRFVASRSPFWQAYFAASLITIPWIMVYLMTDVAIFDERALLFTIVTLGLISAHHD